jgi:nicotinamide mononucleotide transporter
VGTLEFISSVLTVFFVVALAYQKAYAWPVGIAGTLLAIWPYYEVGLVAEALLQAVYAAVGAVGWWQWNRARGFAADSLPRPSWLSGSERFRYAGLFLALWAVVGIVLAPWSSMPWADTALFSAGVWATWLEANRKMDAWLIWIGANAVSVWTAWERGLYAFAGLYALLVLLSVYGLFKWTNPSYSSTAEKN